MQPLGRFLLQQNLPLGLLLAALVGILAPAPGQAMARLPTQHVAVSIIFVCAGLRLRTDHVWAALGAWRATLWASLSILLITPVLGTGVAGVLPLDEALRMGLVLFCCMPTTLSSGIALTTQARGNMALALLLTVFTNLAGVITVPVVLAQLLGVLGAVELAAGELIGKLCWSIMVPLAAGWLLRWRAPAWAQTHGLAIGLVSNAALVTVPWMTFSNSAARLAQVPARDLLVVVAGGLAAHLAFLATNAAAARALRLAAAEAIAVVLVASQKTLPVALTVLAFLPVPAAVKGLVAIPCVAAHLIQIFVDAIVATRWRVGGREGEA